MRLLGWRCPPPLQGVRGHEGTTCGAHRDGHWTALSVKQRDDVRTAAPGRPGWGQATQSGWGQAIMPGWGQATKPGGVKAMVGLHLLILDLVPAPDD